MKAGETMNDKNEEVERILISVEEACKITGIGRNTMLKLVKTPGFPALLLSRKILIDKNGFLSWLVKNYGKWKL